MPSNTILTTLVAAGSRCVLERGGAIAQSAGADLRVTPEVLVVRGAKPSVVYVEAGVTIRPSPVWYAGSLMPHLRPAEAHYFASAGSGLVIDVGGYVVTNFHVVEPATRLSDVTIKVQFDPEYDATVYSAQLVSWVAEEDLALLKIQARGPFPVATLGTSADLMLAERVISIGSPFGNRHSVHVGIVSGLHRSLRLNHPGIPALDDLIQTDAAVNPGSSGGPLLNILGEVIGITTASRVGAENLGYAIPIDRVKRVLREQLFSPSAARAWYGFEVTEIAAREGSLGGAVLIAHVSAGGPADEAGLEAGTRVLAVNDVAVADLDAYHLECLPLQPGEPLALRVECRGSEETLALTGWARHQGVLYERLGLTVASRRSSHGLPYVQIVRVRRDSPAADMGLAAGDFLDGLQVAERDEVWRLPLGGGARALRRAARAGRAPARRRAPRRGRRPRARGERDLPRVAAAPVGAAPRARPGLGENCAGPGIPGRPRSAAPAILFRPRRRPGAAARPAPGSGGAPAGRGARRERPETAEPQTTPPPHA